MEKFIYANRLEMHMYNKVNGCICNYVGNMHFSEAHRLLMLTSATNELHSIYYFSDEINPIYLQA